MIERSRNPGRSEDASVPFKNMNITNEQWKEEKKKKKARFTAMQNLPYEVKVKRAELRAIEFVERLDELDMQAHVSVGGLDSITLLVFLRKIGIDVPAILLLPWKIKAFRRCIKNWE